MRHIFIATLKISIGFGLILLLLATALTFSSSPILAQETPCPVELSCPTIRLPEGYIGDFFLADVLLAGGQNAAVLQIPPGQQQIVIRNIQSPDPNFNQLFVYQETTVNVNVRAGQAREYNASPRQQFIRGTLNFTCRIANVRDGEGVACSVTIDGVYRSDVPLEGTADYILDPGDHAIQAQVIGSHAQFWSPGLWQGTSSITAGRTTRVRSQFAKQGHLIITLNQPGVVGDFYINGELIAGQVPTADRWVIPGTALTIEVRNLVDPAANGVYRWLDAATNANLRAGQERTVTVRLRKELLPTPIPAQGAVCDCSGDNLNCSNFGTHNEAQACHDFCVSTVGRDINGLDGNDNDGLACESLP